MYIFACYYTITNRIHTSSVHSDKIQVVASDIDSGSALLKPKQSLG